MQFEEEFLSVPQECLILTMQTNQKYFALTDSNGKLRSRFLIVSNLETSTPEHIIGGNERVVRPRLSDAKFFFEQDKKKPWNPACRNWPAWCITTNWVHRQNVLNVSPLAGKLPPA
jgi:glycyl-tRNA synthetase beta subunit